MDKNYMRSYYRRFYENPCDFVISESDEFKEKRDLRYKLEDELTEMLGGTQTLLYRKFDFPAFLTKLSISLLILDTLNNGMNLLIVHLVCLHLLNKVSF